MFSVESVKKPEDIIKISGSFLEVMELWIVYVLFWVSLLIVLWRTRIV